MQYVLFDVETTGLSKYDEVIQFCCFIMDGQLHRCSNMVDFYSMSTQPITQGALQKHHVTLGRLRELSKGVFFEESFYKLAKTFERDCTFIYFSSSNFDTRLVNQTLQNANLPAYNFGDRINTLRSVEGHHCFDLQSAVSKYYGIPGGRVSLEKAVNLVTDRNVNLVTQRYKNFNKVISAKNKELACSEELLFHNARFDAFVLWYILHKIGDSFVT